MPSDREYEAPVARYNNRLIFNRFKWAEEAAHVIDKGGYAWVMFRDHDILVEEDGDVYTSEQYVVLWNE